MKKVIFFILILSTLILTTACNKQNNNNITYTGELTIVWIWPIESFEPTVSENTLVLKKKLEDYSDHIFVDRQSWSNYLDIKEDIIPGNTVKFSGTVKTLDAAAGNHYYHVSKIDVLEKIKTPNAEEIRELINKYSYCENDLDCKTIQSKCHLDCHIPINKKYRNTAKKL